jgi:dynein assembly factor with WDR repeat domains 1
LVDQIIQREPLTKSHKKHLEKIIKSSHIKFIINRPLKIELIEVVSEKKSQKYSLFKSLPCHDLPLTNCAFNKNGDKFITGSYDQTCIIWDTETGNVVHRLKGHKNVVYAISFNLPYGDKVATGSFDSTAKVNLF